MPHEPRWIGGRYRLEHRLGAGGMGEVFRAWDERLQRPVAIKMLFRPSVSDASDEELRARALHEARAAAALGHPNIVAIHDVDVHEGEPFTVMELLEGTTLRDLVGRDDVPIAQRVDWLLDLATALDVAHAAGLVHRDVKPDNVLVTNAGVLKVLDFGIARRRVDALVRAEQATPEGVLVGTPAYMAPEQARGEPLDGRADQFAWGVVAYELLTGRSPWEGTAPTFAAMLVAVMTTSPRPIETLEPAVPPHVASVVMRSLSKSRDERFGSMRELREALAATRSMAVASIPPAVLEHATGASTERAPRGILAADTAPSANAVAVEAYRSALVRMRAANWVGAHAELGRALDADPALAPALLRGALTAHFYADADTSRKRFLDAARARDRLAERDRALLPLVEAIVLINPPDFAETLRRARAVTQAFPNDAELLLLSGFTLVGTEPELARRNAERALEIDPGYADAWQMLGGALATLDRFDEAREAFERCVAEGIEGADVVFELALLAAVQGDVQTTERHARRGISVARGGHFRRFLLGALFARGARRAAIAPLIEQAAATMPPSLQRVTADAYEAVFDILEGQFSRAAARLDANHEGRDEGGFGELVSTKASLRLDLAIECGDLETAGALALAYLDAREAAPRPSFTVKDLTPLSAGVAARAGALPRRDAIAERDAWLAAVHDVSPGAAWGLAFAPWVDDAAALEDARRTMPAADRFLFFTRDTFRAEAGLVLLRIGEIDRALALLRIAARACLAPTAPFRCTRAHLWLGEACEARGLRDEAIAAYRTVLSRWGHAPSVSAMRARKRLAAMGETPTP